MPLLNLQMVYLKKKKIIRVRPSKNNIENTHIKKTHN